MQNYGYSYNSILHIINESMNKNRLFHACMIHGGYGIRKTYLSNEIAKQIISYRNENNHTTKESYLQSPDLYIISKNSPLITVDDIREVKNWIKHTTMKSKYKVVVINDVDRMNKNASNAFLKVLEEPIGNAIFILNTSSIRTISDTLSSRCIKIRLNTPTLEDFTKILCELHCLKPNVSFETVYCLCKGDINLAIKLIEQKYLDSLIKLFDNDIYDEALNIVAALDLENEMDFRVFHCFIDAIASKLIGKGFSKYELLKKNYKLLINLEKLQNIVTNLDNLNKKYSQEIIINILKECF